MTRHFGLTNARASLEGIKHPLARHRTNTPCDSSDLAFERAMTRSQLTRSLIDIAAILCGAVLVSIIPLGIVLIVFSFVGFE